MLEKAELQMYTSDEEAKNFIIEAGLLYYASNHTEAETKRLIKNLERELKSAEKLKTSVDYKREKERKAMQAQKEFEKTDKGKILKNIKNEFQAWNQKGEFEKQSDYELRLKEQSKNKFNNICIEQIKNQINYHYENGNSESSISMILLPYNADNEFFQVIFRLNKKEWISKINIPITKARHFKNIWNNLELQKNYYDWCIIDNYLFPTIITLQEKKGYYNSDNDDNTKYLFNLTLDNKNDITILFDDLKIDNKYLKGYIFNYSIAKELVRQKFIRDSLNYDSIVSKYNKLLLNNPYNINQKVLKVEHLKRGDNYEDKISLLKEEYEKLNKNFKSSLKRNNPSQFCKIYYSIHPDKKVEADKKYIDCKCNLTRQEYDIKFINNNLSAHYCNCREKEYLKYGNLFVDKNEFNSFFEKGDSVYTNEIEKRTFIAYIDKNADVVKSLDLRKEKKESFGAALLKNLANIPHNSYKSENQIRERIINIISKSQNKNYYSFIVDKLIKTNQKLYKEWTKNGKYFINKVDFFNTYMLVDYKKKLKERKKAND